MSDDTSRRRALERCWTALVGGGGPRAGPAPLTGRARDPSPGEPDLGGAGRDGPGRKGAVRHDPGRDHPGREGGVREEVLASWRRSRAAVTPSIVHAPVDEEAPARWRATPAAAAFAPVADDLARAAADGDLVAAVTDRHGTIVWTAGGREMRRRAERVGFVPGGRWDEPSVGTNALALALRDRRPATVWSAEHFAPMVHDWVCHSAPIVGPDGSVLGVVDLSATWRRHEPLAELTVAALARVVHQALPPPGAPGPPAAVEVRVMGGGQVLMGGVPLLLAPRHLDLVVVLSLAPRGLRLDELHDRLHGDRPVSPGTTRAELSHLRRHLGPVLASRPYRLRGPVRADHLDLLDALAAGRLDDALDLYRGPLLARSAAPAVVEQRHVIDVALRTAVLAGGDADQHVRLAGALPDDPWVLERALARLAPADPRRAVLAGRLAALDDPGP